MFGEDVKKATQDGEGPILSRRRSRHHQIPLSQSARYIETPEYWQIRLIAFLAVLPNTSLQYSRKGQSTTDAQLYILQAIYEAMDSGDAGARIFYADFSKGFDLIDHNILMTELQQLDVDEALFYWIRAFLTNRRQAVRIGGNMSDWKALNGGVPQGTKLGVILFSVMTNRLLSDWKLHIKFVDDTSAIEILPRNSISLLNSAATDIHQSAIDHNMRLNPPKCKEMLINFMHYSSFSLSPIIIGNKVIERVSTYNILSVHVDCDLKWNTHVELIYLEESK